MALNTHFMQMGPDVMEMGYCTFYRKIYQMKLHGFYDLVIYMAHRYELMIKFILTLTTFEA
jgi:hypothetical protein